MTGTRRRTYLQTLGIVVSGALSGCTTNTAASTVNDTPQTATDTTTTPQQPSATATDNGATPTPQGDLPDEFAQLTQPLKTAMVEQVQDYNDAVKDDQWDLPYLDEGTETVEWR